jgi:L-aspartate oxidase
MRGEGGWLINEKGERFMERIDPKAELAPRDVVSRAIASEMHRTGERHVYLDLRHLEKGFVKKRFPRIYSTCHDFGLDIEKEPVPVSPAMHYIMGGVETDINGATSLPGLYAAGECACTGIHGANRLASNSLLEGLVYGARSGEAASGAPGLPGDIKVPLINPPRTIPEHDEIRGALRRLMWENVGIVRCEDSLKKAGAQLRRWGYVLNEQYLMRRELELKNMLQVAGLITKAALKRKESVGAHFRTDCQPQGTHQSGA